MGLKARGPRLGFHVNQPSSDSNSGLRTRVFLAAYKALFSPQDPSRSLRLNWVEYGRGCTTRGCKCFEKGRIRQILTHVLYWNMKLHGIEFRPREEYFECIIIQINIIQDGINKYFKF